MKGDIKKEYPTEVDSVFFPLNEGPLSKIFLMDRQVVIET